MVGLLHIFYGFVGNYGIAIIMLTVLVRGCMFPISRGQAKSMAKLQELQPEMERIKEKYKGDQQKQAQAMQQLYRKHNVNPLARLPADAHSVAGVHRPVSRAGGRRRAAAGAAVRRSRFAGARTWRRRTCSGTGRASCRSSSPAATASSASGPYLNLLPLVTIGLFLWQQKMFMPEPANEQAAMQQKIMKYMMVFMGILFYKVPSGLCLYFIASSLWGIGERKLFPPPTAATLDGRRRRPPAASARSRSRGADEKRRRQERRRPARGRGGKKAKRRK